MYMSYPIADIKNIDRLREDAGLPPLSFEIIVNGYPPVDGYKISEADFTERTREKSRKYEMMKSHDN